MKCVARLKHTSNSLKHDEKDCGSKYAGLHYCRIWNNLKIFEEAEKFIIKTMHQRSYGKEILCISKAIPMS